MAQIISSSLQTVLDSQERDLLDVYELFPYTETNLDPANATLRFSSTRITWAGNDYNRALVSRGDVSRYITQNFNSVSLTLSNVDKYLGGYFFNNEIEGMRLVVRTISRSVGNSSIVLFVGRCEKAVDVDRKTVTILAKQDLGSIDVEIPTRKVAHRCPLLFKGTECLGNEAIGAKSAAYQAATTCNKSWDQCQAYTNINFFQGFRYNGFKGSFRVKQPRGGAGGALLSLIGLGNHRVTKQWTAQDDSSLDKPVPLCFGRAQIQAFPIVHADTGQYIAFLMGLCEGPVSAITNVHNVAAGFAETFQAGPFTHKGNYGSVAGQPQSGFFTSSGDTYSRTAYVEGTIKGDNPDTGDPAPDIVALVRGQDVTTPNSGGTWNTTA